MDAESIRTGIPGPDSLLIQAEALAELCHRLAGGLSERKLAEDLERLAATAERAALAPAAGRLDLLLARFAKLCYAAADAGQLQLPDNLPRPQPARKPSDSDVEFARMGQVLLLILAKQLPDFDSNPLGLVWQAAGSEQRATPTRQVRGHSPPDYKELVVGALLQHHRPDEDWRSLGCWDPAKQMDILKTLRLKEQQKGRVSEAMAELFARQKQYAQLCRRKDMKLLQILQTAVGERPQATGAADRIDGISGSKRAITASAQKSVRLQAAKAKQESS